MNNHDTVIFHSNFAIKTPLNKTTHYNFVAHFLWDRPTLILFENKTNKYEDHFWSFACVVVLNELYQNNDKCIKNGGKRKKKKKPKQKKKSNK